MDVVNVLFLWGLLQFQEDNGRVGVYGVDTQIQYIGGVKCSSIYKNVRACSINVVMAML